MSPVIDDGESCIAQTMEPGGPEECNLETFITLTSPEVFSNFRSCVMFMKKSIVQPMWSLTGDRKTQWRSPGTRIGRSLISTWCATSPLTGDQGHGCAQGAAQHCPDRPEAGEAYEVYVWAERGNQGEQEGTPRPSQVTGEGGRLSCLFSPSLNRLPHGRVKIDS